jgi:hypothetical protein
MMARSGAPVGGGTATRVFISARRAAIWIRRSRGLSNRATRQDERRGIGARRLHGSRYGAVVECLEAAHLAPAHLAPVRCGLEAGRAAGLRAGVT